MEQRLPVESGEIKNLTFINQQHKATITVVKDVQDPTGDDVANDAHVFYVTVDGQ
ncbi:MAG: hypothetical protein U5N58_11610 [Actinomycetota bacterium]|nr:hypothetical protein [Actinomycetota bacterium]